MSAWQVWSHDSRSGRWLVVDEGEKQYCLDSARFRNSSAEKHGVMDAKYEALPAGQEPHRISEDL